MVSLPNIPLINHITSLIECHQACYSNREKAVRTQFVDSLRMNRFVTTCLQHRGKTSAHASTLHVIVLRTWWELFRTFPKAQNGGKKERLHCASLQPDFERKNKHVILKARNKYSQKVQEIVLYKNMNYCWQIYRLKHFVYQQSNDNFRIFVWNTFL
jgi:hypothetical protein